GLGAVGEVSAVRQHQSHDGIAVVEQGEVGGHVRLRPRVGLYVGVLGVEKLLGAGDGQVFYEVHILAAAVVALAGIAFGVFVGEIRASSLEDGFAGVIFRCDQVDGAFLPFGF